MPPVAAPGRSSAGGIATITPAGVLTGVAAGQATITYAPPSGCYAIKAITVNPLPGPVTGNTDICIGLTTALADTSAAGTWSSASGAIATITLPPG